MIIIAYINGHQFNTKDFSIVQLTNFRTGKENKSSKEISELIEQSFNALFEKYINRYPDYKSYKIRVTGSIGHIFDNELKRIADQHGCKIDMILQKPILKLIDYHTNNYE